LGDVLTTAEMDAIRRRLEAVTPGRWREGNIPGTVVADTEEVPEGGGPTAEVVQRYGGVPVASDVGRADLEFITNAKEDIRRLLLDRQALLERLALLEERRWSQGGV